VKRTHLPFVIIGLILLIDQTLKIWIKTNMVLGEEIKITNWFFIHFLENPGMAFGMQFGGSTGKMLLTLLRIVVVTGISWWLYDLVRKNERKWLIASVSLIVAGAMGNILDSCFYGLMFDSGTTFDPELNRFVGYYGASQVVCGGGYAPFLYGCVVDMFYFPLFEGTFPKWFPFIGGNHFQFFRPVFNIADSAITVGVTLFFILQIEWGNKKDKREVSDQIDTLSQR
jgi:signal peptidase II